MRISQDLIVAKLQSSTLAAEKKISENSETEGQRERMFSVCCFFVVVVVKLQG